MKSFCLILLTICCSLMGLSQDLLPSYWTTNSLVDEASGWTYYLGEDERHYYVGAIIPAGDVQDQIRMCGLTLWVGKKPEKKGTVGIHFPMGYEMDARPTTPVELSYALSEIRIPSQTDFPERETIQLLHLNGKGDTLLGNIEDLIQLDVAMKAGPEESLVYQLRFEKELLPRKTREKGALTFTFLTGTLDRPTNLRGTDAQGINYNTPAGQIPAAGQPSQARLKDFYFYSEFTKSTKVQF
ncbi:MAG: hypothetical protein AAFR59_00685, partial [Bacteroidota bacterium]